MDECRNEPTGDNTWSAPDDDQIWARLLTAGGPVTQDALWISAIRTVAEQVLLREGREQPFDEESDEEGMLEDRITDWLNEELPCDADVAWVVRDIGYFREIDLTWEEKICFVGEACGYNAEVVDDLKVSLSEYPEAREAITPDGVEEFYAEWRTRFLMRVLHEAEALLADR